MVFSSILFLIFFLPALLLIYFCVPGRFRAVRNTVLLAFSLVFYACGGIYFLPVLLASVLVNYLGGLLAAPEHSQPVRRTGVWLAVLFGLGMLAWFKYAGFFVQNLNALGAGLPVPQVVLPIGISFFTFQGLSYVIDVYRGNAECQRNPLYVALYVALFPQLVAGPIVRYSAIEAEITRRTETVSEFSQGCVRFLFGLAKKMLLANAMGEIADAVFELPAASMAASLAWLGGIAYTFQIYFDFSAYSDMAIGLGRMFGFHFEENFNYPYISRSVGEFWRRWHISLSTWFRDYVYIPLGGSRCSRGRNIFNLAAVWLLTGLWHGADWTYVLWGGWFLLLLLGEKFLWGGGLERLPSPVRHIYTMAAVVISWVLFRADSPTHALGYFAVMFGFGNGAADGQTVYLILEYWPEWIACIIAALPVKIWLQKRMEAYKALPAVFVLEWCPKLLALAMLVLSYMKLATGSFNPFIYFQF